MQDMKNTGDKQ